MARLFEVRLPLERAYTREAMLAVELLDSVTLERVVQGIEVTAEGLIGKPYLNGGGLFVWLNEDATKFKKLTIEPRTAPFERVEIPAAQVTRPLHREELRPLASYPFSPGVTAIRGSLYETRVPVGNTPAPIAGATISISWLDDDGISWRPSQIPTQAPTVTTKAGAFISIMRFARGQSPQAGQPPRPDQLPLLDAQGMMTIRLSAKRTAGPQKQRDFQIRHGRVADQTYAWDELL